MSFCSWFGGEKYKDHFKQGKYVCSNCENELFASTSKYKHSTPWPAFTETIKENSIVKRPDGSNAYKVSCGQCGQGLGHEFIGAGPKDGQSRF